MSLSFLTHKMRTHFCPKGVAKVTHVKTHTEDLSLIGATCRICVIASPRRLGVLFQLYRQVNWGKKKLSKPSKATKLANGKAGPWTQAVLLQRLPRRSLQKLITKLPQNPAMLLLWFYPRDRKTQVHRRFVHECSHQHYSQWPRNGKKSQCPWIREWIKKMW